MIKKKSKRGDCDRKSQRERIVIENSLRKEIVIETSLREGDYDEQLVLAKTTL